MNIKNFKIGDSIQYQLPLFDPQEGKITKIYTDSVVVNNTIHVSEKYIIKKVNKDKISINDLKIGDKVKYYWKNGDIKAYIGEIKDLELNWFYILTDVSNWVYKDNIISKLEHVILEPQYKEIPIEKEEYNEKTCIKCQSMILAGFDLSNNDFVCSLCLNKEKSAPKSFKFDINIQSTECKYDSFRKRMQCKMTAFSKLKNGRVEEGLVLPYDYDLGDVTLGKTYTVEIKEKE